MFLPLGQSPLRIKRRRQDRNEREHKPHGTIPIPPNWRFRLSAPGSNMITRETCLLKFTVADGICMGEAKNVPLYGHLY
jgi:hypothetical protein